MVQTMPMLTRQFLITLTLPTTFVLLALLARRVSSRQSRRFWMLALVAAALWASSILSFYVGTALPAELAIVWRAAGRYGLSALALLLFLTTTRFLQGPSSTARVGFAVGAALWLGSLALDPLLWPWARADLQLGDSTLTPFSRWSVLWVVSWLVPLYAAWLLTRRAALQTPRSLYRNRLNYWQLTLLLFLIGGGLGLVQEPRQPVWQQVGAIIQIGAAILGNRTLRRHDLPDLKPALRQLAARLASTTLLFVLAWAALWSLERLVVHGDATVSSLDLLLSAALFAAIFMLGNRFIEQLIRRLLLPRQQHLRARLAHEPGLAPNLADPAHLAKLVLRLCQATLVTEHAHVFRSESGPGGSILLESLASLEESRQPQPVVLAGNSPLTTFLRREARGPLSTFDLRAGQAFNDVPLLERETIASWQSQFLLPLHAGPQLVGVLALGDKLTGAPYSEDELLWLQALVAHVGPLLWQAQQIATLDRLNNYVFERIDNLTQEQQFLQELSKLYRQFTGLVSPQLYVPFGAINSALQQLESAGAEAGAVSQPLTELRTVLGHLVNVAGRVQQQHDFHFAPMLLHEAVQQAVRNLAPMAEARRVHITVTGDARQPTIKGDEERLVEAVQHLLHNAIKFNRIGGSVELESGMVGNELYLHIRDTGVGIPPERTNEIWSAFSQRQNGRYRGSSDGVGLLLTRFIVGAHGGRLEMTSRYGAGSTFTVFLPLALEA
jgi:signal transduction histidine kinase